AVSVDDGARLALADKIEALVGGEIAIAIAIGAVDDVGAVLEIDRAAGNHRLDARLDGLERSERAALICVGARRADDDGGAVRVAVRLILNGPAAIRRAGGKERLLHAQRRVSGDLLAV